MRFRCFFHNLIVPPRTTEEEILQLFSDIENETQEETPFYSIQSGYKVLLRNERKVINGSDNTEQYFLGKMVKSEKDIDYGEEKEGNLSDLTVEEGTGIFNKRIGVVYYLLYINTTMKKYILMLENVPFTIGSGTFVRYLNERLESANKKIESIQIAGKDFEAYLNSIGSSYINVANIRLKKHLSDDAMEQIGVIDDILKLANDKEDFSIELTVHWYKKKRVSVTQFLQSLTHKEQISDIAMTNFSEIFRTFAFEIENSAQPNVNLLDRLLRFEVETEKLEMSDAMIYTQMYEFFIANKTQIT